MSSSNTRVTYGGQHPNQYYTTSQSSGNSSLNGYYYGSTTNPPVPAPADPSRPGARVHYHTTGEGKRIDTYTRNDTTVHHSGWGSVGQARTVIYGSGTGPDHSADCQKYSQYSDYQGLCFCPR